MSRVKCLRCKTVLAAPRGSDRLRFIPAFRIVSARVAEDGSQALEGVCPECRGTVIIPLPLDARALRGPTIEDLKQAADASL